MGRRRRFERRRFERFAARSAAPGFAFVRPCPFFDGFAALAADGSRWRWRPLRARRRGLRAVKACPHAQRAIGRLEAPPEQLPGTPHLARTRNLEPERDALELLARDVRSHG
jgi:hypothetical protein